MFTLKVLLVTFVIWVDEHERELLRHPKEITLICFRYGDYLSQENLGPTYTSMVTDMLMMTYRFNPPSIKTLLFLQIINVG